MFSKAGSLLALIGFTAVSASPLRHGVEDIQCRCLSVPGSTESASCASLGSRGHDWYTAYSFASQNHVKIQFATKDTISRVLAIPSSLPTSVLAALVLGEAFPPSSSSSSSSSSPSSSFPIISQQSEDRIVCEFSRGTRHTVQIVTGSCTTRPYYFGVVVGTLNILIVLYIMAEYVWTSFFISPEPGNIKLEGDEKALMAVEDVLQEEKNTQAVCH